MSRKDALAQGAPSATYNNHDLPAVRHDFCFMTPKQFLAKYGITKKAWAEQQK